jgi:uncharacterized protein
VPVTDDIPLVDHHCHGVIAHQPDGDEFRVLATEADRLSDPGTETLDGPYGLALKKFAFPLFGLGLDNTYDEYLSERARRSVRELNQQMVGLTGSSHLLIDTGLHGSSLMTPEQMQEHTGVPSFEIIRLERLAEEIAPTTSPTTFISDYAEAIRKAAERAVGFKSIIAYRYGLDVDDVRPSDSEVQQAVREWQAGAERSGSHRLSSPVIMKHLLWQATDIGLPIQFHVGYGDSDIQLFKADPSRLTKFLTATVDSGSKFTLLHCYPFIREAAILSQIFPHVYADVGVVSHFMGPSGVTALRQILEIAPFNKVLYSSDAYGLPEHYLVSALSWRSSLGRVLDEWMSSGWLAAREAERLATLMIRDNALRVYRLDNR